MNPDPRYLEWPNLQSLVRAGAPAIQPVPGDPSLHIFVDEGGSRLGLRTALAEGQDIVPSPLAAVTVRRVVWEGSLSLEVGTDRQALFKEFYDFLKALADRIQVDHEAVAPALSATIANWHELLRPSQIMSPEQQLGLSGELWTLSRLLRARGPDAIMAWTGPSDEPHDFRIGDIEIEVKSTWRHRRVHAITSLDQLQATPGRRLFLLSLQMENAGYDAGWSLPDQVDEVRRLLAGAPLARTQFDEALHVTWRYADEHAADYATRIEFRQPPMLVEIGEGSPRITRGLLDKAFGHDSGRIPSVRYDLDVDGRGALEGSEKFLAVLPEAG